MSPPRDVHGAGPTCCVRYTRPQALFDRSLQSDLLLRSSRLLTLLVERVLKAAHVQVHFQLDLATL